MLVGHDTSASRCLRVIEQQLSSRTTAISRNDAIEFTLPGFSVSYEASILQCNAAFTMLMRYTKKCEVGLSLRQICRYPVILAQ